MKTEYGFPVAMPTGPQPEGKPVPLPSGPPVQGPPPAKMPAPFIGIVVNPQRELPNLEHAEEALRLLGLTS